MVVSAALIVGENVLLLLSRRCSGETSHFFYIGIRDLDGPVWTWAEKEQSLIISSSGL